MLWVTLSGHGAGLPWIVVNIIRIEDGLLKEHWDVIEDEATRANSLSGLRPSVTPFRRNAEVAADRGLISQASAIEFRVTECCHNDPSWARNERTNPMPMIDVYAAAGTFGDPRALAQKLAYELMAIEQVPDIPMFRQNSAAFIHYLPAANLSNVDGDSNYVRIQVLTNAGALDRGKQLAVVEQLTRVAAEAAGDPTLASRIWVLLTEAPDVYPLVVQVEPDRLGPCLQAVARDRSTLDG
jgi:phenylpyruvate tautomerase PptA (4-oxalocrotonate tautomerase family)